VDGAAELFRERAFMSDAAARAEAARVAVDLRVGDAAIGRLLLDELAAEYYRAYPLEPRSVFDDRVVEDGFLPVRLLRFRMLP
jgi:hypothetical protein